MRGTEADMLGTDNLFEGWRGQMKVLILRGRTESMKFYERFGRPCVLVLVAMQLSVLVDNSMVIKSVQMEVISD